MERHSRYLDSASAEFRQSMAALGLGARTEPRRTPIYEILVVAGDAVAHEALVQHFPRPEVAVSLAKNRDECFDIIAARSPSLVVVDLDVDRQSGLTLVRDLKAMRCRAPIVAVRANASIFSAVEAMKSGAADFYEKPLDFALMMPRLRDLLAAAEPILPPPPTFSNQSYAAYSPRSADPRDVLTRRELEVLAHVTGGASNKQVGRALGISPRTVEVHRSRLMIKLGARNAADLVRIVLSDAHAT